MKGITPEMMEKAKNAKNAEELLALAKENGVAMSEDEAQMYYDQLNPKSGELSDDDLDAVAGGGCQSSSGRTVVTSGCSCFTGEYQPIYDEKSERSISIPMSGILLPVSHRDTVRDDTKYRSASCSWVNPFSFRKLFRNAPVFC